MRSNYLACEIVRGLQLTILQPAASSTIAAEAWACNGNVELNNCWQYARKAPMMVSCNARLSSSAEVEHGGNAISFGLVSFVLRDSGLIALLCGGRTA